MHRNAIFCTEPGRCRYTMATRPGASCFESWSFLAPNNYSCGDCRSQTRARTRSRWCNTSPSGKRGWACSRSWLFSAFSDAGRFFGQCELTRYWRNHMRVPCSTNECSDFLIADSKPASQVFSRRPALTSMWADRVWALMSEVFSWPQIGACRPVVFAPGPVIRRWCAEVGSGFSLSTGFS